MNHNINTISPTAPSERILSIDVLRGFAVLGILIMNIQSFSMVGSAYINPTAFGDLTGINKWVWITSHFFANAKFMSIFSMLFGAGIVLFYERAISKGLKAGTLHYRRNLWLFIFGMIHAYLIWYGDILVAYSLCAFLVYLFRKTKPKTLLIVGFAFFIIPVVVQLFFGMSIKYWPQEAYDNNMQTWFPPADVIQQEIDALRGTWMMQMEQRASDSLFMQTFLFFYQVIWRVVSMMLLGMALYKWGVLSAARSRKFYSRMLFIGLILGYTLVGIGINKNFLASWSMDYSMFIGKQFNYFGSVGVALGYIGLIMLICKSDFFTGFKRIFAAVGKMAFTNYILMSVICTFIFYGYGFGLFGQVERSYQSLIVAAIWVLILLISPWWLKNYNYGPLEWLWRGLTYVKFHRNNRKNNPL
ncbi:MAG: DUF418 domain-containing protein [Bacteroidales bacterium]|nr:DUF418 domain-containing protein [Bacteroidales bacterium]